MKIASHWGCESETRCRPRGVGQRALDLVDRRREDVPEEEDQDPDRDRAQERLRADAHRLHPTEWQSEEDRRAGDRAEQEDLTRGHVRRTLQNVCKARHTEAGV